MNHYWYYEHLLNQLQLIVFSQLNSHEIPINSMKSHYIPGSPLKTPSPVMGGKNGIVLPTLLRYPIMNQLLYHDYPTIMISHIH